MIGTQIYLNPEPIGFTPILSCFTEHLSTGKNFTSALPLPPPMKIEYVPKLPTSHTK